MKTAALGLRFSFVFLLGLTLVFAACAPMAPFSATALAQATSIKVDALALMDKATEPFDSHKSDVAKLQNEIEKAYEYAKSRPHNEFSRRQWEILVDPSKELLGGFLRRWENKTTLSKDFIDEAKGLVSDGFKAISDLESGKKANDEGK